MFDRMTENDEAKIPQAKRVRARYRKRGPQDVPYEPAYFAAKHGLTQRAARVIITANGPSRNMCDAAARAFLAAVAARVRT